MIITERSSLRIEPMSESEMRNMCERYRVSDPELSSAYAEMLDGCIRHPDEFVWYACHKICLADGTFVGDLCFKGMPAEGDPEIGYGILDEYQGRGYATEAVRAACKWALEQPGVVAVSAEAEADNAPSLRVLEKVGFVPTGEIGAEGPRFRLRRVTNE